MVDNEGTWHKCLKNIGNGISNTINKAASAVVKTTKVVVNMVVNTTTNITKSIINNFVAEVGFGTGSGATLSPLGIPTSLTSYKDKTWGIANGKTYTSIVSNASAQAVGIGPSYQFEHPLPLPEDVTYWENDPYHTQTLLRSPYAKTSYIFDVPFTNFSKKGIFVGIELELHFGIGGHIKIGWDIK
jgi:hypothetical protein